MPTLLEEIGAARGGRSEAEVAVAWTFSPRPLRGRSWERAAPTGWVAPSVASPSASPQTTRRASGSSSTNGRIPTPGPGGPRPDGDWDLLASRKLYRHRYSCLYWKATTMCGCHGGGYRHGGCHDGDYGCGRGHARRYGCGRNLLPMSESRGEVIDDLQEYKETREAEIRRLEKQIGSLRGKPTTD